MSVRYWHTPWLVPARAEPQKFGTGYAGGIVASEAGNNATVCGALVPLITLGIPGSGADVFLLAALVLHKCTARALADSGKPRDLLWHHCCGVVRDSHHGSAVVHVHPQPRKDHRGAATYPGWPVVLLFCAVGVYAFNNSTFDLAVLAFFGGVGLLLKAFGIPLAPFIIGFVLAGLAEDSLRSALMLSRGDFMPFLTRPVSAAVLALSVLVLVLSLRRELTVHGARP